MPPFRYRFAGIIGNVLGHYDQALFAFLAPFIAPLFFDQHDPLTALILTYGMLPLGILTRPLGSLFFGWIGDRLGRTQALFYSLMGMAVVTIGMGCLPLYREAGIWAPISLAIGRMVQNFCAAGESTGGAIFVLEHTPSAKRSLVSSFYDASSMGGILIASGLVTYLSVQGSIMENWRLLFWLGGAAAFWGLFLRLKTQEATEFARAAPAPSKILQVLKGYKRELAAIVLVSGFAYTTYSLAFTLMNGYVPLVSSLTKADVMKVNTALLIADMALLPCFGYLAHRLGKEKVMQAAALLSATAAVPLFYFLDQASFAGVIAIRLTIMVLGIAFAAPYHAWALERVPPEHRYTILSLGSAFGSQLIGAPTSALCLWLYQKSGWVGAPGIYLMAIALAASYALMRKSRVLQRILEVENKENI